MASVTTDTTSRHWFEISELCWLNIVSSNAPRAENTSLPSSRYPQLSNATLYSTVGGTPNVKIQYMPTYEFLISKIGLAQYLNNELTSHGYEGALNMCFV